jgi:hypothetical protein
MLEYWMKASRTCRAIKSSTALITRFWLGMYGIALFFGVTAASLPLLPDSWIQYFYIAALICMFVGSLFMPWDVWRYFKAVNLNSLEEPERIRRPYPSTKSFSGQIADPDCTPVGGAIPVHGFRLMRGGGANQGVEPDKVIINKIGRWRSDSLPDELLQSSINDERNETKCVLSDIKPQLVDRMETSISLKESDWNTIIPYTRFALKNQTLRHKYSCVDKIAGLTPANCVIPSAFCLHGIVAFEDESILVMNRGAHLEEYRTEGQMQDAKNRHVSLSFEEQMKVDDFGTDKNWSTMEMWTRRALCEEIFPLKTKFQEDPELSWNLINDYVADRRIWSFIFEETIAGWAVVVYFKLRMTWREFLPIYKKLASFSKDSRDAEGNFVVLPREELISLIESGHGDAHTLAKITPVIPIYSNELHATSLFRALTYGRLVVPI